MDVGVDTGGTFTDLVGRRAGQPDLILKVASTPDDPSRAVLEGLAQLSERATGDAVQRFVHGTTVATNAVLERKGAVTGLVSTAGFRDVLEIGRQIRTQIYDLELDPETPVFLAPGARRVEVPERISADGEVLTALDETALEAAVTRLVEEGVEAVAVCFLFSFLNPVHEYRARELITARFPSLTVSLSCDVDPAFREYERTVVTTFDAYTKPVLSKYLARMSDQLRSAGVTAPLQVMQSRGGISAAATASERPVRLFLSGPAAGVIGGGDAGLAAGIGDVITVDIGGTSCDVALVSGGKPLVRPEGRIDGYPVRVPMVDVNAIGSGGGSVAWIDAAGGLRVGPHSAGADPGPACYGRGGTQATVTDASLVLGYLNPGYFAGGTLSLDAALARAAVENEIAKPLGLSVEDAALGIHRVLNAQMAEAMRLVSIRQGFDPRDFALVALGGAGPVHAVALAEELSIGKVIVPRHPGVLSAAGLLSAPVEHEVSVGFPKDLDDTDLAEIRASLDSLDARCDALMAGEALEGEVTVSYAADVCFVGQSHYLEVSVDLTEPDPLAGIYRRFLATHEQVFGYSTESPARLVNLRAVHRCGGGATIEASGDPTDRGVSLKEARAVIFDPSGAVQTPIHDRAAIAPGERIAGPAVLEQADTTTVLPAGWNAEALQGGAVILSQAFGA